MAGNLSLDWQVEQYGTEKAWRIANAIWHFCDDVVRKQVPDLQEYFSFDRSYFFQTHFYDAGWFAIRIYPRRDSGITTGPGMDDVDVLYLKSKDLRQQLSFSELASLLGADWLSEDRFTYVGPYNDGSIS
jgi:hypothetical protein